jgi:hypothetical protein
MCEENQNRLKPDYGNFQSISIKAVAMSRNQLTAVFLIFGVVSAQSQGFSNLLLRRSLAKNQKSSLLIATSFLSML